LANRKTISWNRKAVEQAKAQGFDNPNDAICPGCGTNPAMKQFGRYQCECGELEGFETGE
jgi:pyruvate/2-oxoacid:ferredoxin oxidoreductase beta subunit